MRSLKKEIKIVYNAITHPAGFDVGCSGVISIRQYESPIWAVEWEEYCNPYSVECKSIIEVLEFTNPMIAAECFVELRHKCNIGLDAKEKAIQGDGFHLLGNELQAFKEKYIDLDLQAFKEKNK